VSPHGYAADKEALVKRLHRIEGQVRGIERMIEDDRYCIDVLTQISAATTALESLAFRILDEHVNHCVADALASGDPEEAERKSAELLAAVHRFSELCQAGQPALDDLHLPRVQRNDNGLGVPLIAAVSHVRGHRTDRRRG
jgi:DNA-binding FrmR family transcriptional regulator